MATSKKVPARRKASPRYARVRRRRLRKRLQALRVRGW